MDPEVWRWVLEFLARKRMALSETLIRKLVRSIPIQVSQEYFRCKKAVILDALQEVLSTATIAEHMLEELEVLEEFYHSFGLPVPATMPAAYCAVAVESTLKYLDLDPLLSENRPYLDAVERIWHGRVHYMGPSAFFPGGKSELFTAELKRWSSDIEASLQDPQVRERLRNVNSRREAIQKLSVFLDEASEEMGPSFLEFVASLPTASAAANRDEDAISVALPFSRN